MHVIRFAIEVQVFDAQLSTFTGRSKGGIQTGGVPGGERPTQA